VESRGQVPGQDKPAEVDDIFSKLEGKSEWEKLILT
jgi:hypothetical protein